MIDRITILKPDDWHLHVRENEFMRACLPHTAAARASRGKSPA
jgi:dihydroorotase